MRNALFASWALLVLSSAAFTPVAVAGDHVDPVEPFVAGQAEGGEEPDWGGFGTVYTASNEASGNEVLVFTRGHNGDLHFRGDYPTGGMGAGMGLGNQGGVTLTDNGRWLLVVNAGSDEISVFEVLGTRLVLTDIKPSGGQMPVSVTIHHDLVYVLNGAGPGSITGFELDHEGELTPLPNSTRPLSSNQMTAPAQVEFNPAGRVLVVTEKATNLITTFTVDRSGLPGMPMPQMSSGETPFGFGFAPRGTLIVSEAFGGRPDESAVSSYDVEDSGQIDVISASVRTTETAACWIVVTNNGRFTYTTNTGSGTITGYAVRHDGRLSILDDDGVTAETGDGSMPIDMALSKGSRYLYALNSGTHEIVGFRVNPWNGSLHEVTRVRSLPPAANGLAAK